MNPEFEKLLQNGKLISFPPGKTLIQKEMLAAESDLFTARKGLSERQFKWSTIQGYYAMFHAARALIFSRGYREKSHYCLVVALKALFLEENLLPIQMVRDYSNAMRLREAADYETDFSPSGAEAVIQSAERFIQKAREILNVKE